MSGTAALYILLEDQQRRERQARNKAVSVPATPQASVPPQTVQTAASAPPEQEGEHPAVAVGYAILIVVVLLSLVVRTIKSVRSNRSRCIGE